MLTSIPASQVSASSCLSSFFRSLPVNLGKQRKVPHTSMKTESQAPDCGLAQTMPWQVLKCRIEFSLTHLLSCCLSLLFKSITQIKEGKKCLTPCIPGVLKKYMGDIRGPSIAQLVEQRSVEYMGDVIL